ncbi:serine/threonine protein kinase [bacterium]|nr:serine/threonine protein kinase [bacterium]
MNFFLRLLRLWFSRPAPKPLVVAGPPLWSEFAPAEPNVDEEMPTFEGYEILGLVGRGEMGAVYKAVKSGQPVALKTGQGERFEREVEVLGKLGRLIDAGPGYAAVEWVEGVSLEALLARRPLEVHEFSALALQLLGELQSAHDRGVYHRDVKSANVMVSLEGRARLVDFGLALGEGDARFTMNGYSMGTPAYMAPEVLLKGVSDARSDQYSLGVLFFEMLSGWPPFQAECPMELGMMHVRKPVPDLRSMRPEVPAAWVAVIARMLAKEPAARYDSLAQIAFKAV